MSSLIPEAIDAFCLVSVDDQFKPLNLGEILGHIADRNYRRPEHESARWKVLKVVLSVSLLAFELLADPPDGFLVVLVKDASNVGRNLAEVGCAGRELKPNHIELVEPSQPSTRRPEIVANEITLLDDLQLGTNQVFTNASAH